MRRWLVRRTLQAAVTLMVALVLLFLLAHVLPGDPLSRQGEAHPLTAGQLEALRARYGLDRPLLAQLGTFLLGLARGDLGLSIEYGRPVTGLLAERLPATLLLGGTVLLLNFTLGLWLGVRQAVKKGTAEDGWLTTLSLAGYATPSFWLGLVLAWLVGIRWHLLPPAGMRDPLAEGGILAGTADVLRHLLLPALTLSALYIAYIARLTRSGMLEVMRSDYIRTARAKGLNESQVVFRHALRGGLLPVVSFSGPALAFLITGTVVVERVFALPGLGNYFINACFNRDEPLIIGIVHPPGRLERWDPRVLLRWRRTWERSRMTLAARPPSGVGHCLVSRGDDVDTTNNRRHTDRIHQNRPRRFPVSRGGR